MLNHYPEVGCRSIPDELAATEAVEDEQQDENLKETEKRNRARLRTRGPYRKTHAD